MSLVAPTLLSATLFTAIGGFAWNLRQANAETAFKTSLRIAGTNLADTESSKWQVPPGAFALLLKDDGTVAYEVNAPRVLNTNFLRDNDARTSRMFHKMKSRALSGGGYVTFQWVGLDGVLKLFTAYAVRNGSGETICLARAA